MPGHAGGARQLGARRRVAPGRPLPADGVRRQDAARVGRGAHALPQDALRAPTLRHQSWFDHDFFILSLQLFDRFEDIRESSILTTISH